MRVLAGQSGDIKRILPDKLQLCCGMVNRGFAILGDRLFMATLDAHVIALDTKTGNVVWDVTAADYRQGYTFTVAPLAVKNEVIVGASGGEYGIRGFVDAYDAATGRRLWRFEYRAGPQPARARHLGRGFLENRRRSGLADRVLRSGAKPDLLAHGKPIPSYLWWRSGGDNLYSNCMLALDADTGKLKWYFQFTPHDVYDYDATEIPVLIDADWDGQPRKLLIQANRNGFLYVLDRTNGKFLSAKAFGKVTWAKAIGPDGRPIPNPAAAPKTTGTKVCPGPSGLTNWFSPSYDPVTKLLYVATSTECEIFILRRRRIVQGTTLWEAWRSPTRSRDLRVRSRLLTPLREQRNGSSSISAAPTGEHFRPRVVWSLRAIRTVISLLSTRRPAGTCGTSSWARPSTLRP